MDYSPVNKNCAQAIITRLVLANEVFTWMDGVNLAAPETVLTAMRSEDVSAAIHGLFTRHHPCFAGMCCYHIHGDLFLYFPLEGVGRVRNRVISLVKDVNSGAYEKRKVPPFAPKSASSPRGDVFEGYGEYEKDANSLDPRD